MDTNRNLKQSVTWWAIAPDGFGGDTFAAPVVIKCRWEEKQEVIAELSGLPATKELMSKAVVFVDRDIKVGDYLCLGDKTPIANPTTVLGALKVQTYGFVTDLRNVSVLRKARL